MDRWTTRLWFAGRCLVLQHGTFCIIGCSISHHFGVALQVRLSRIYVVQLPLKF